MNPILDLLSQSKTPEIREDAQAEIFKNQITNKTEQKNTIKTYAGANSDVFTQEGLDYEAQNEAFIKDSIDKRHNIDNYISDNKQKIPLITHQAYFTASNNTDLKKTIDPLSVKKSITTTTRLNEAAKELITKLTNDVNASNLSLDEKTAKIESIKQEHSFKHIFWTNNLDVIPQEIKDLEGVEIHLIDELKDENVFPYLEKTLVEAEHDKGKFAEASDIVRILGVKNYGGIYHDLDYEVYNAAAIIRLTMAFHFIGGKEIHDKLSFIGNAFFAASKGHPIIEKAAEHMERNLDSSHLENIPDYIRFPETKFHKVIYETGPAMLTVSFFKEANNEGYDDIILPRNMLFNAEYAWMTTPESRCHHHYNHDNPPSRFNEYLGEEIETYGADMFCGDWGMNNQYHNPIYYTCDNF